MRWMDTCIRLDKFPLLPLRFEFVRPYNSSFVENFRTIVGYYTYKYTRHTALSIAVDFQPAALRLSKYRLALRTTLLVWPRTSLFIISRGLFIRSVSSRSFHRLRRETHPSYSRHSTRRTRANPLATTLPTSRLPGFTPSPCRVPMTQKYESILAFPRLKGRNYLYIVQANSRHGNDR